MPERHVGKTDEQDASAGRRVAAFAPAKRRRLRDAVDRVVARVDHELTRAAEAESLPWQHDRYW